ncbi:MAG: hypothetical protein ACJ71W_21760 [Terriglobales bacterium]
MLRPREDGRVVNSFKRMEHTMATKSVRKAINYQQIQKLAEQGLGALEIAKKTNRLIKGSDPAHSIRAILSRMRTHGWKNKDGKTVKLKIKRVGFDPKPTVKKTVVKPLAGGGQ